MKALHVSAPGGLDRIAVVETPTPVPGPGEVGLRMRAVSLNYRDLLMVQGRYARSDFAFPITPFSDGCGIVEAIGPGVTRVQPGDRVAPMFFQRWLAGAATPQALASALGHPIPGVGREFAVYSEQGVSTVPDFLSDHQVAALPCAALTAWRALFHDARLLPGQTVLLQGTGGVSIFGLQFAHAAGMETIVTSSSDAKLERARALGATHVINYQTHPEWSKEVRRVTHGRGVDFVMEVGGQNTLKESLKSVTLGGHIAIIGVLSGSKEPLLIPAVMSTNARLQGVSVGSREMFEAMTRAIERQRIEPVIDKVFPWQEARAALETMQRGEHFGKIVLDFG
ncbi:MAG TPA: NAD(P)-dependent alcohol dehydrogenase [Burkholderiales bacterium]|nr:NAD(P)-dependent alcohol dehydrogenase [Burkholderiales bacterium]